MREEEPITTSAELNKALRTVVRRRELIDLYRRAADAMVNQADAAILRSLVTNMEQAEKVDIQALTNKPGAISLLVNAVTNIS